MTRDSVISGVNARSDRTARNSATRQPRIPAAGAHLSGTLVVGIVGLLIGAVVAFLLRPSGMFVGQLPFETVISRGANLSGLELLLVPLAQRSFNMMLVGAILGSAIGLLTGKLIGSRIFSSAGH